MFVQTETTPNDNALKFIAGNIPISKEKPYDFPNIASSDGISQLAKKLFEIGNINRVFYGSNFITITKDETTDWSALKPHIFATIVEHMTNGWPIFDDEDEKRSDSSAHNDFHSHDTPELDPKLKEVLSKKLDLEDPIIREILALVEERVRPAVAMDGGDIVVKAFSDGIVYVQMLGACNGCSSSSATLKGGVETMLKHYIPEVKEVVGI